MPSPNSLPLLNAPSLHFNTRNAGVQHPQSLPRPPTSFPKERRSFPIFTPSTNVSHKPPHILQHTLHPRPRTPRHQRPTLQHLSGPLSHSVAITLRPYFLRHTYPQLAENLQFLSDVSTDRHSWVRATVVKIAASHYRGEKYCARNIHADEREHCA